MSNNEKLARPLTLTGAKFRIRNKKKQGWINLRNTDVTF